MIDEVADETSRQAGQQTTTQMSDRERAEFYRRLSRDLLERNTRLEEQLRELRVRLAVAEGKRS